MVRVIETRKHIFILKFSKTFTLIGTTKWNLNGFFLLLIYRTRVIAVVLLQMHLAIHFILTRFIHRDKAHTIFNLKLCERNKHFILLLKCRRTRNNQRKIVRNPSQ